MGPLVLLTIKDICVKYTKYFAHAAEYKERPDVGLLCQVALFLQLHRTTSALLEVSNWGEPRPTFDGENFRIDTAEESKTGSEVEDTDDVFSEDPVRSMAQVSSPDSLSNYDK
jgi:hypothetical protein